VSLQDHVPSHAWGGSFELRPPLGKDLELRLGGDARFMSGESREFFLYVAGEPTRRRSSGGESSTGGAFAELTGRAGRVTLSGGARLDHWSISDGSLREWEIATGRDLRNEAYSDRSGWLPTARAGAGIDLKGGYSLRSAVYLGWRMPTLNELFRPFRAGSDATAANPELDPERLSGIEGGIDYRGHRLDVSLTVFANRLRDAIANVTLGHGPGVFPGVGFVAAGGEFRQRRNLSAIHVQGVEASARYRTGPLSLGASGSFVHAKVDADDEAAPLDALRPAQTPRFMLSGEAAWERDRRALSLIVRHVGNQFEDDLNQRKLRAATVVDAFAAWPVSQRLQIVFRAENLLDEVVQAGIGGDGSIERGTPRTLWLGFRLSED
jgi:outer membrane receptor protein involved in Fe transport